jgi:hypothetical protein
MARPALIRTRHRQQSDPAQREANTLLTVTEVHHLLRIETTAVQRWIAGGTRSPKGSEARRRAWDLPASLAPGWLSISSPSTNVWRPCHSQLL